MFLGQINSCGLSIFCCEHMLSSMFNYTNVDVLKISWQCFDDMMPIDNPYYTVFYLEIIFYLISRLSYH